MTKKKSEQAIMPLEGGEVIVNDAEQQGDGVQALMQLAITNKVDVGVLERLMGMRKDLRAEQAREAYFRDMALFQSECPVIEKKQEVKDKDRTTTRYKFAPLEFIDQKTRDIRQKYGFSHSFDTKVSKEEVEVTCTIKHRDGHSEKVSFIAPIDDKAYMNAPQKTASAMTFAKRYAFVNGFGIIIGGEDNDTQDVAKPKNLASDEQKAEIDRLSQQAGLTKDVVVQRIRELYGISYTQLTDVQAQGVIASLKKKLAPQTV